MNLVELKTKSLIELIQMAVEMKIENANNMRKQELIFAILSNNYYEKDGKLYKLTFVKNKNDGYAVTFLNRKLCIVDRSCVNTPQEGEEWECTIKKDLPKVYIIYPVVRIEKRNLNK